jgi:RNA polymerase sigma-70 factor, ECF subfamily
VRGNVPFVPAEIERLYREHRAGLVRLVERELHDHDDAEDVVQTAFLDAQRALEGGTIPRHPRAWLAAIALNAARRLRRRRLNAEPLEDYAVQEAWRMPELRAALTSLPREQRAAVLYRDVLGLSYGETAAQMGTTVNAVTMLLHRGRLRLRQTLGVTVGGVGLWRWLRRAGTPQVAVAKGAGAIVLAAGLATGGIVTAGRAARAVAPSGTGPTLPSAALPGSPAPGPASIGVGRRGLDSARRQVKIADSSVAVAATRSAESRGADAKPISVSSLTTGGLASSLPVPKISLPTVPPPTLPVTVAVTTPVVAATVTAPVGTTATVTTPVITVTVPVP